MLQGNATVQYSLQEPGKHGAEVSCSPGLAISGEEEGSAELWLFSLKG